MIAVFGTQKQEWALKSHTENLCRPYQRNTNLMFDNNPTLKRWTLQIWAWRTLDKVQGRCCHLGSRALLRKILAAQRLPSDEWFTKWALRKSSSKAHISDVAAAIYACLIFFRPRSISSPALLDVTRERRASWRISLIIPLSEAMIMDTQGRKQTCDWRLILYLVITQI